MTEPTDEQLEALAVEHEAFGFGLADKRGLSTHGFDPDGLRSFARAVLAKWCAPPQISESDAAYWLRHRALILQAIEDRGFRLVSAGGLFWLSGSAKPSPTPQADSQPALPKITAEDRSFLHYNPNTDDIVEWVCRYASAAITADRAARAPADSVREDAARWQALPAFFEEYQIDAMKLYRDIDAYLDAARKQGANHD